MTKNFMTVSIMNQFLSHFAIDSLGNRIKLLAWGDFIGQWSYSFRYWLIFVYCDFLWESGSLVRLLWGILRLLLSEILNDGIWTQFRVIWKILRLELIWMRFSIKSDHQVTEKCASNPPKPKQHSHMKRVSKKKEERSSLFFFLFCFKNINIEA